MTAMSFHPRFPHGRVFLTARAVDLVREGKLDALSYLERHLAGDWGEASAPERNVNEAAITGGNLLVSRYTVAADVRLVILTNLERRLTKLMLLCEFLDDIDD